MSEYRIIEITGNDGYPRTDGRYPLRTGRICVEPKPTRGYPLYIEYLKERDGSDYSGRYLRTSRVVDYSVADNADIITVHTTNATYTFERTSKAIDREN